MSFLPALPVLHEELFEDIHVAVGIPFDAGPAQNGGVNYGGVVQPVG